MMTEMVNSKELINENEFIEYLTNFITQATTGGLPLKTELGTNEEKEEKLIEKFFDGGTNYEIAGDMKLSHNVVEYEKYPLIRRIAVNEYIVDMFPSPFINGTIQDILRSEKYKKLTIWGYEECNDNCECIYFVKKNYKSEKSKVKYHRDFGNIQRKKQIKLDEFLALFCAHEDKKLRYACSRSTDGTHIYLKNDVIYSHYLLTPIARRLTQTDTANEIILNSNPNTIETDYAEIEKIILSFNLKLWYAPDCEIDHIPLYFIDKKGEVLNIDGKNDQNN